MKVCTEMCTHTCPIAEVDGKRKQHSKSGYRTKTEAMKAGDHPALLLLPFPDVPAGPHEADADR